METEAQNLRIQTQELEEELSEAENSRLRLEVTLQALKAQFEREISTNEEKGEEKRRALSKQVGWRMKKESAGASGVYFLSKLIRLFMFFFRSQVRELEIQLEEERSQRSQSVSSKKQLEAELQEAEAQVETANRGKEEAMKQLRRLQVKQGTHTYLKNLFPVNVSVLNLKISLSGSNEGGSARAR